MSWQGILGHDEVAEAFRRTLERQRLASSYLFTGPDGVGKRTFALKLAQTLLCHRASPSEMAPCGECASCQQVMALTHPDVEVIGCPEDKSEFPVRLLIGEKERRNREGFCYNLSRKPQRDGRKIGILDDADMLNEEGANCLLKILEEPPPRSLLILLSNNVSRQLPTIRSRCQILRFRPLVTEDLETLIRQTGVADERAKQLAGLGRSGLTETAAWAEESFWDFRGALLKLLAETPPPVERLIDCVQSFVDHDKPSPNERRRRMHLAFREAQRFYRDLLHAVISSPERVPLADRENDKMLSAALARATDALLASGRETATDSLTQIIARCLTAQQQVSRNANPGSVIGCWADDLDACLLQRA
jgi:DNA polymerase-3 subunit delta'